MDEDFNQLKVLTEVVKDAISHKENGSSKKLMYFIRRSLSQMGLTHECEESEILIQAYLRTRDKILSGTRISNYSAYLTRVAYFVILDESKRRNRRGKLNKKLSYVDSEGGSMTDKVYTEGMSDELVSSLWSSFESLTARERHILILRIVKGLPWREIGYLMVQNGQEKRTGRSVESKLRKQGERALAKLRKQLLSVNDESLQ